MVQICYLSLFQAVCCLKMLKMSGWNFRNRTGDESTGIGLPRRLLCLRFLWGPSQQGRSLWAAWWTCLLQVTDFIRNKWWSEMKIVERDFRPHYELICCAADYGNTAGSVEDLGSPDVSSLTGYYSANEQSPVANVQKGRPRKRKLSEVSRSDLPVSMRLAAGNFFISKKL